MEYKRDRPPGLPAQRPVPAVRAPHAWILGAGAVVGGFLLAALLQATDSELAAHLLQPGPAQSASAGGSADAQSETYRALFREAKNLFNEKRYQESLKILERCLSLNREDPELYKLVASDAILVNRMDIAEQALNDALRLAPSDSNVLFNLGALYYTGSRFLQAQPVLEKSVKLNPDYVPARLFLGLTLEELGQEASAIAAYQQAIEIAARTGFKGELPYLYLGRLLYRQNKMNESLPFLQKAAQVNPGSCESLCLVSRVLSSQGRETQAAAALEQCLKADAEFPEAHYLLSRIHARAGQSERAAQELALFQQLRKNEKNRKDPRKNQRAIR